MLGKGKKRSRQKSGDTVPHLNYFTKCNLYRIQKLYFYWFIWHRATDLNQLAVMLSAYVGYIWRRGWGKKPVDPDLLDPVTYKLIMLFHDERIPFHRKALSKFLHITTRRAILDEMDRMYPGMPKADHSMMLNPKRFKTDADIDASIFLKELNGVILKKFRTAIRFSGAERAACVSIATSLLFIGKAPSYKLIRSKYGIRPRHVRFFNDFVRIVIRNELYDMRASLPRVFSESDSARIYGNDE